MKLTKEQIVALIEYEKRSGIHTYHLCECKRHGTRAGRCWECLAEDLERIKNDER